MRNMSPAEVETVPDTLAQLVSQRILYEEKGKYFTLALPTNQHL